VLPAINKYLLSGENRIEIACERKGCDETMGNPAK
jgi:hypothetical protein